MKKQLLCMTLCMLMLATVFVAVTPVLAVGNQAPTKPVLTGPNSGKRFIAYTFNATATDPDGDYIAYNFSWGEDNYTGWIMPYVASGTMVTAQYTWIELGVYNVTVKAKDVYGSESISSDKVVITIVNDIPNKPTISGPVRGTPGTYAYTVVGSDPDHDDISYYTDWGDGTNSGWRPFVPSGTPIDDVHTYAVDGVYVVKVKSKDTYEAESVWSENLTVVLSSLNIKNITGGIGINAVITNDGTTLKTFDWIITTAAAPYAWILNGGYNSSEQGYNTPDSVSLAPGGTVKIDCSIFGFGFIRITVTLTTSDEMIKEQSVTGFVFGKHVFLLGGV